MWLERVLKVLFVGFWLVTIGIALPLSNFSLIGQPVNDQAASIPQLMSDVAKLTKKNFVLTPRILSIPDPWFSLLRCRSTAEVCPILATTYADGSIAINGSKVDLSTVYGQAVIVHELIHVIQFGQLSNQDFNCVSNEDEAYRLTHWWAAKRGLNLWVPTIDELRFMCSGE